MLIDFHPKVILGLIFPPLILFLGFRSNEELRSMPQTCEEHWEEGQNKLSDSEGDSDSDSENLDQRNEHDPEVNFVMSVCYSIYNLVKFRKLVFFLSNFLFRNIF